MNKNLKSMLTKINTAHERPKRPKRAIKPAELSAIIKCIHKKCDQISKSATLTYFEGIEN